MLHIEGEIERQTSHLNSREGRGTTGYDLFMWILSLALSRSPITAALVALRTRLLPCIVINRDCNKLHRTSGFLHRPQLKEIPSIKLPRLDRLLFLLCESKSSCLVCFYSYESLALGRWSQIQVSINFKLLCIVSVPGCTVVRSLEGKNDVYRDKHVFESGAETDSR